MSLEIHESMVFPSNEIISGPDFTRKALDVHLKTKAAYFRVIRQKLVRYSGNAKADGFEHSRFFQADCPQFRAS
jgi:hypothetical protein